MKPRYKHDCDKCIFLGAHNRFDLYICKDTLIARESSEDGDYASGLVFAFLSYKHPTLVNIALEQAYLRAKYRNLLYLLEEELEAEHVKKAFEDWKLQFT